MRQERFAVGQTEAEMNCIFGNKIMKMLHLFKAICKFNWIIAHVRLCCSLAHSPHTYTRRMAFRWINSIKFQLNFNMLYVLDFGPKPSPNYKSGPNFSTFISVIHSIRWKAHQEFKDKTKHIPCHFVWFCGSHLLRLRHECEWTTHPLCYGEFQFEWINFNTILSIFKFDLIWNF